MQSRVLEAMCGSGQMTGLLLSKGADVTGLDISPQMIASYKKRWPGCHALCASILDSKISDDSFDSVVVVGGLHHLHPYVDQAVDEIYRILKPDGYFCFVEPHAVSFFNCARRAWYKLDPLFEKNENPIDIDALKSKNAARFEFVKTEYGGSFAYLLVLNSFIFRVPLWLKRFYAPPLIALESLFRVFLKIKGFLVLPSASGKRNSWHDALHP